jgi:hypothetical protein
MTICPHCGNDEFVEEINPPITVCTRCSMIQEECLTLNREECLQLSKYILMQAFLPRDYYDVLKPIVDKIIKFGDTGRES